VPEPWRRYVAIGDSFTEGMCDVIGPDGRHVGWADRLAQALADRWGGIEYANLAIRGRLVRQVVDEQVPAAVALGPDLVTFAAGVNDCLRSGFDLDATATAFEWGVRDLRGAGTDVLVVAFGDPSRRSRVLGSIRDRIRAYNTAVEAIAVEYGCRVMRFWDLAVFDDDDLWDEDRLHLSPAGHRLACSAALAALGLGDDGWRTPTPLPGPPPAGTRALGHARWIGRHAAPWVLRRLRGESSGDGMEPKRPDWTRVPPQA
jgi:lysophospholipase L1-like esterase